MKPREKNIVNKIKVQERIWEFMIIIKWTNCDIVKCQLIRNKKPEYICKINILDPASGSRGGLEGEQGVPSPPPTTLCI